MLQPNMSNSRSSPSHHEEHLKKSTATFNAILENQTLSLGHLVNQYQSSEFSKNQLKKSLNILNSTLLKGGKVVISGIGKSHKIASKVVATLNSLSLNAALLHPSEALHGDLGILRQDNHDCLIFISSSGKTPELIQLLPHISLETPIILLTNKKNSLLSQHFQVNSLLYAELPSKYSEEEIYGLTAPTISTTLCLALADAVSIALAELYISDYNERKKVFSARHPGGAIGEAYGKSLTSISSLLINSSSYNSSTSLSSCGDNNNTLSPALNPVTTNDEDVITNDHVTFQLGVDGMNVVDKELLEKVHGSKHVYYSEVDLKDEAHIYQTIALYDYIVVKNSLVTSSEKLKAVMRIIHDHEYGTVEEKQKEMNWRINAIFTSYNS